MVTAFPIHSEDVKNRMQQTLRVWRNSWSLKIMEKNMITFNIYWRRRSLIRTECIKLYAFVETRKVWKLWTKSMVTFHIYRRCRSNIYLYMYRYILLHIIYLYKNRMHQTWRVWPIKSITKATDKKQSTSFMI